MPGGERLPHCYEKRGIYDIVWLVVSEHVYNGANHGLESVRPGCVESVRVV